MLNKYQGKYYVCGTGRQTLLKNKTANDTYYLLTMAAIAQELKYRKAAGRTGIVLVAGLPLASFGREKLPFREYLFRKDQPLRFRYEKESYEIRIEDVKLFPQGYSALALHPEFITGEAVSMFPFQQVDFEGDSSLEAYIKQAESLGLFGTGVLCDNLEQVLTLVTCSYEWESARNVVVA